uniref:HDC02272 n=1 Tax=Drosophila melanogaster TaxID=7227 RepID=Q6IHL1_DROME|nr:TPA_inf: HDC02272 [Drosophila melanogaster]
MHTLASKLLQVAVKAAAATKSGTSSNEQLAASFFPNDLQLSFGFDKMAEALSERQEIEFGCRWQMLSWRVSKIHGNVPVIIRADFLSHLSRCLALRLPLEQQQQQQQQQQKIATATAAAAAATTDDECTIEAAKLLNAISSQRVSLPARLPSHSGIVLLSQLQQLSGSLVHLNKQSPYSIYKFCFSVLWSGIR